MKAIITLLLLFFSGWCQAQYDSIFYSPAYRTYLLRIPAGYNPANPAPLIIAMHGGFGSGPQLESQSQLTSKAGAAGFIVVYPEGVRSPGNIRTWNAGKCCGYSMNTNVNDVGFITSLIDSLRAVYSIDSLRIYATGMSNGAFMSYRLACERSNIIAAIAPVAGSMAVNTCNPSRGVPVIHFHSYLDTNVPYDGGVGSGFSNHYNPPIDSVLNVWSANNTCSVANDTLYNGNDCTHVAWTGCSCGNQLELYITADGGHSWPGGQASPAGDPASTAINANDLMLAFFQQHKLGCSTTAAGENGFGAGWNIFPNPTRGKVYIDPGGSDDFSAITEVINVFGEKALETPCCTAFMDVSSLPDGIYFLRVRDQTGILHSQKLVLVK